MAALQRTHDAGYPEPSASFTWWLGDTYAGNFGKARSLRLNPFAAFRSKGLIWANGSDFFVTPFPARYGVWAAVARQPLLGVYGDAPFGTKESVDVKTALRAVTIWAARQMFLERKIGSDRSGQVRGPRRVGPRSVHRRHRSIERHAVSDDDVQWKGRVCPSLMNVSRPIRPTCSIRCTIRQRTRRAQNLGGGPRRDHQGRIGPRVHRRPRRALECERGSRARASWRTRPTIRCRRWPITRRMPARRTTAIALAEKLSTLTYPSINTFFFTSGGAEARRPRSRRRASTGRRWASPTRSRSSRACARITA